VSSPVATSGPPPVDADVQAIIAEQAALRRVATLAARAVSTQQLFAAVNQELAELVGADAAALLRFEPSETITLLAAWNSTGAPVAVGEQQPVNAALRRLRDAGRDVRCGPADVPLTVTVHRRATATWDPRHGGGTDPGRRSGLGSERRRVTERDTVPSRNRSSHG
jgi:GAF domain-containing protein